MNELTGFDQFSMTFLWKESLNSDGQQFHQCQQKRTNTSYPNWTNWTQEIPRHNYDVGNSGPGFGQAHN